MTKLLKKTLMAAFALLLTPALALDTSNYDSFQRDQRAKVLELYGKAWVQDSFGEKRSLKLGDYLYQNEVVTTGSQSHLILNFQANGVLAINESATVAIGSVSQQNFQHLHILKGQVFSFKNPEIDKRIAGLVFSTPLQDQLFHAPRLEIEVIAEKTRVFVQKGQLTRIKMAPSKVISD